MDDLQLKLCDIQGRLFSLSADNSYASEIFIRKFMASSVAKDLDSTYNRMQWAGEEYLLAETVEICNYQIPQNGDIFSKDILLTRKMTVCRDGKIA